MTRRPPSSRPAGSAINPSVAERLARLAPDQRDAATATPGPVLCIAPAGSGKTTTLVARVAWLVAGGTDPATIAAITFNKRAAEELEARLVAALAPLEVATDAVRVRTFHALGREILASGGVAVEPLLDRGAVLDDLSVPADAATRRRLDDAFSRLKLDLRVRAEDVAADTEAGPLARLFVAYEAEIARRGGLDFDDLVARALRLLEREPAVLDRWRRQCGHLLVDEVQDVDRSQLALALILTAPANRIFLVGDDDQSIYGWRLADVRRVLDLEGVLPGLRRIDLETNYRCPRPVVERAVRLVECNRERFAKRVRAGPVAGGALVLAGDGSDDVVRARRLFESWPDDDASRAVLARTNRELAPAAAVALELDLPFRATDRVPLLLTDDVEALLDTLEADEVARPGVPLLARIGRLRGMSPADPEGDDLAGALLAWAAAYQSVASFAAAVRGRREALDRLRRDDAPLTLATAHATKGLEFDHVGVIGLDEGRFPSARTLAEATEPDRVIEEERRLAYVAWTRAHRSLTLIYDPAAPSPFMLEAFTPAELGTLEPA